MDRTLAPGTVMPYADITDGMFSLFRPMIQAADGLSLGQVCAITGLEPYTVQNWVKRGFVAHPVRKKYYERQFARILLISALRDCMKIEQIGEIMRLINGDTDDESDDIISESRMYDYLCEAVRRLDGAGAGQEAVATVARQVTADYRGPDEAAHRRLDTALQVMICAHLSCALKREADLCLARLQEETR